MAEKSGIPWRRARMALLAGLGIAALFVGLYMAQPALLRQLDHKIYDALLTSRPAGTPAPAPAVVDIDEASLTELGQWPWPRYMVAELLARLYEGGAAAVGLDILFTEPDRSSPIRLREGLKRDFGLDFPLDAVPPRLRDNDAMLADVLGQTPTVSGFFVRHGVSPVPAQLPPPCGAADVAPAGCPPPRARLRAFTDALLPLPLFRSAPAGFINVIPDMDGLIRSVPLLSSLHGKLYANLSLRTLMSAMGVKSLMLRSGPDGLEEIRVGKLKIPVNPDGSLLVPFRGGQGVYPYFSARDVLAGRVKPEDVQGRVIFVGTSAAGLQDIRATPFAAVYPGVEVHAAVTDAILSSNFIQSPPWTPGAQVLAIVLSGLLTALACGLAPAAAYLPLGAALAGGAVWGGVHVFAQGMFISPLYVVLTVAAELLGIVALRFWQEEKQKRVLRNAFSHYVAPEIVNRIAERGGNVLAGEEREVTIVFTDVRGFTTLSEKLLPQQVVALLNRYFTPMTACIRANEGTLDKFIGDAIMAFWNAPLNVEHHPDKAVLTVLEMQEKLAVLNTALQEEFGVTLRIGGGVHTGMAHVGNMGSEELLDYTCIGDNVNLASRLEGMCSKYGVGLVASGETVSRCEADVYFRKLDTIRVKGKTQPVDIYTALRPAEAEARREEMARAESAMQQYHAGAFAEAEAAFSALEAAFPASEKLYALYAERCHALAAAPPAQWDGIWTFSSK